MATLNRRPLSNRHVHQLPPVVPSGKPQRIVSGTKRPRSPEQPTDASASRQVSKRIKAPDMHPTSFARDKVKERKLIEREQQKTEFKDKYTRAFPSFTFYFDELNITHEEQDFFEDSIEKLGGKIVKFLDKTVTHFISNRIEPDSHVDKENSHKSGSMLKSPIKLKSRLSKDVDNSYPGSTTSALAHKIWNTAKLESVLQRLIYPLPESSGQFYTSKKETISLERLLKYEQWNGTTERDPTQKRHDFKYFTKSSRFVLIEDIREELSTIAAHEYAAPKCRDGVSQEPWPVLHCHPHSRGPFIPFDDKEKRRWEKLQKLEKEHKGTREPHTHKMKHSVLMKRKTSTLDASKTTDLRRSLSMNNLRRRATFPNLLKNDIVVNADAGHEEFDSTATSAFAVSAGMRGYMAASGNSVGITSTTGTTSTTGYASRSNHSLITDGRLKHIVTSRKFPATVLDKENIMGPPSIIPGRPPLLRKSRSTNTLRLPKREEGSKPGYCESCRMKFEDFQEHITGRKHQRFATNAANFLQLDCVLARVQRRTKAEVTYVRMQRESRRQFKCANGIGQSQVKPALPSEMGLHKGHDFYPVL
ncbi:hypothetical protein H0H93_010228 [Arthromyces matolae]|nr:hypothetical protein H0H93_010228 [Arthromyces matolae]